jgi:hypothetical protein
MFDFVAIVVGLVVFFFVVANVTDSKVLPKLPCKIIESKTGKI